MIKHIRHRLALLLILVSGSSAFAQPEALSPLITNFQLTSKQQELRSFPDIFLYEIDTVHLPFLDDFSRDRFKKYNAQPGDPNVSSTVEYRLYDAAGTTVLNDSVKFMTDTTYSILYDTLNGQTISTFIPLPDQNITVLDLTSYPFNAVSETVWPRYNIVDTAYLPSSPDTIWLPIPDLVQDSVTVYSVASTGDNNLWVDSRAYLNSRYAVDPPTIGVATFDGLDETGYPYDFVNITLTGVADVLTSKPIFLGTKPPSLPYSAADSIYLSFFYQSTGLGNEPEPSDSLVLEFWAPDSLKWFRMWSTPGVPIDDFKQVLIPVKAFYFLKNGFQFRFKNYGNLSGSLDHWHVDYVYLNSFRNVNDTVRSDAAFQYDPKTLLNEYISMPWRHFKWNPAFYMASSLDVKQRNNDNVARIIADQNMTIDYQGVNQAVLTAPIQPSVPSLVSVTSTYDITGQSFIYDDLVNDTSATFDVKVDFNPGADFIKENDTVFFSQYFGNYYAYDDGTAEAAYGPQGAAAKLAYRFTLLQPDTLLGVHIHFSPSVYNVTGKAFFLTVWDATGPGGTPGNVLFQNTSFSFPEYINENNGFWGYDLDQPLIVNGSFYVGWQQLYSDRLNIGFDLNSNHQNKIYYNVNGTWQNTTFQGALMMRPVFTYARDFLVGTEEIKVSPEFKVYPNPANDLVTIERSSSGSANLQVMDLAGKVLMSQEVITSRISLNTGSLPAGIYLLRLVEVDGENSTQKLVISR